MVLEAVTVLGAVGIGLFLLFRALGGTTNRRAVAGQAGQWRVSHYDHRGVTRVVVQKTSPSGTHLLDEHVVAEIPIGVEDYDARFLAANATARERRALFEAEED